MEHKTQTAILRGELAKNAAAVMLDVVKAITKRSKLITGVALGASIPHQIVYLIAACVPHMNLSTSVEPVQLVQNYLDAIGMLIVAVAVPIGADIAIYSCIDAIGAEFATTKSKIRSFIFMTIPTGASGFVNFLAPAPMILKGLAAFLVLLIIIAQALRVFFETDWDKLERFEARNAIVIEDEVVVSTRPARRVVSDREKKARKRDMYDAMTNTEKYKWRLAWCEKERIREEKELAQFEVELADAIPVSPPPAGMKL